MKTNTQSENRQEQRMREIEQKAKSGRRKWLIIMIAIMVAVVAAAVVVSVVGGMKYAPYAFIFAILAVAITAKLCVDQMGKVMERQKNEKDKLDNDGSFSRFQL